MKIQTDHGERLEKEWCSKVYNYRSKYPHEGAELDLLLNGGLLPGWENALPVNFHLYEIICFNFWGSLNPETE